MADAFGTGWYLIETSWPDTIKLKSLVITLPFSFLSQTHIANVSFFFVKVKLYQTTTGTFFSCCCCGFCFEPIREGQERWVYTIRLLSSSYVDLFWRYIVFPLFSFTSWPSFKTSPLRLTSVFFYLSFALAALLLVVNYNDPRYSRNGTIYRQQSFNSSSSSWYQ